MSFTGELPAYITVDPATGQEVAVYADGTTMVLEESTPTPAITYEGAPNAIPSTAGTSGPTVSEPLWFVEPTGTAGVSGTDDSGGYSRRGYSRGGYRGYDGYDDDFVPYPRYASGELHPAWGGERRVPGGFFALEDDGGRDQTYLPGPESPRVPSYGAQGGDGGGGGGDVRGLISAWRSRLIGNAYPGSGGNSGYASDSGGAARQREERMRGAYARGLDPTQAAGLSLRPTAMLPRVWGGLSAEMPAYQRLAGLPAAQLAMLSGGYSGSTEDLANNLGRVYEQAGEGKLPSTEKLFRNLASGKGINAMFEGEKAGRGDYESYTVPGYVYGQEPLLLGEASSAVGGLLDAALINEPVLTQAKYSGTLPGAWGSYLVDRWGSKALGRKPGKGVTANRYVARRIFR